MSTEIPNKWQRTNLGAIAEIVGGTTPSRAEPKYWKNGTVCWATPTDITALPPGEMYIERTAEKVTEDGIDGSSLTIMPIGTVLMTSRATIGESVVAAIPITTNQGFCSFLPASGYDPLFLAYWLRWKRPRFEALGAGSTFLEIGKSAVRREPIILPPLTEQQKIAEILGSVDDAIAATKAVIEQTKQVKKGLLQELLTKGIGHTKFKQTEIGQIPESWEVRSIMEVCDGVTSGPRGWAKHYALEGAVFVRSQNVRSGELDWSDKQYVTAPKNAEAERAKLQFGDVLITITGNNTGNVAPFLDKREAYLSQHVALIRVENEAASIYLANYLGPDGPGQERLMLLAYGQSKPGLNLTNIRELLVAIPPPSEMAEISRRIGTITESQNLQNEQAISLCKVKSGLLQDLLSGRVPVSV